MNLHGNVLIGQSAVGFRTLDPTVARHPILVPSFPGDARTFHP